MSSHPTFEYYTAWIPEKYAVLGNIVDIDEVGDGWEVYIVYTKHGPMKSWNALRTISGRGKRATYESHHSWIEIDQ